MKKIKLGLFLMLMIMVTGMTSCKKTKIRKNLEGVWTFESLTHNGVDDEREISGTYDFGSCSNKENKQNSCMVRQQLTFTLNEQSTSSDITTNYSVLDGDKILIGDSEMEIETEGNSLTLTANNDGVVTVSKFKK